MMFVLSCSTVLAQVGFSTDNSAPDSSAMLDVKSTSMGVLMPRMTLAQILAIQNPSNGLTVFCNTESRYYVFNSVSGQWKAISGGTGALGQPFPCGINIRVDHKAGPVAPVTKTVIYGTLTGVPGVPTKCWITSNLGADRQATAVTDTTEASAGWYWQFNRKQAYKHSASGRTPNTAWVTPITENSNWTASNDPCTLELGTPWRIPTGTELTNLFNTVSLPGTWSWLKMHYSGELNYYSGNLTSRGVAGNYWASTQAADLTYAEALVLFTDPMILCGMFSAGKAGGYSIRCVRD